MIPDYQIEGIFPTPIYIAKRDSDLDSTEKKEIEDIIDKGMWSSVSHSVSQNNFIFDTKLKNLKEFCEQHIKKYAEEILNPKQELDFYITQSWLNITKPGEYHHKHSHSNSIISGVFYISTKEDDNITFSDPNAKVKELISFESKEFNLWNATIWTFPATNNALILFPSWLDHGVNPNKEATTDRISLSFNTFVKGTLGLRKDLTELIL